MSVYRAHFGDIGGLPMKFAYFVLGLILCVIIASGMNIYFVRSADQGKARPKMEAAWSGLVWGTSCLFALTLGLALLGLSGAALTPVFWMGTILIMLASAIWGQVGRAGNVLRFILGVLLILVPAIHIILHADTYANLYIWLPSLVLCLSGIGFLAYAVFGSSALIRQKSAAA